MRSSGNRDYRFNSQQLRTLYPHEFQCTIFPLAGGRTLDRGPVCANASPETADRGIFSPCLQGVRFHEEKVRGAPRNIELPARSGRARTTRRALSSGGRATAHILAHLYRSGDSATTTIGPQGSASSAHAVSTPRWGQCFKHAINLRRILAVIPQSVRSSRSHRPSPRHVTLHRPAAQKPSYLKGLAVRSARI